MCFNENSIAVVGVGASSSQVFTSPAPTLPNARRCGIDHSTGQERFECVKNWVAFVRDGINCLKSGEVLSTHLHSQHNERSLQTFLKHFLLFIFYFIRILDSDVESALIFASTIRSVPWSFRFSADEAIKLIRLVIQWSRKYLLKYVHSSDRRESKG